MADTISKAVLITGCSTGIGRATAERLAGRGWTVYATARKLDDIADLAERGCKTLQLDVCDEASMTAAVAEVERAEGAVGALVNNAGYGHYGAIEEATREEIQRQFETNVFGLIRMSQLVLPGMRRQRWGRIVNVGSMGGKLVFPGGGLYHATKFAVEALSDALRYEVKNFGIAVSLIEPGVIKTQFGDSAVGGITEKAADGSPYAAFNAGVEERVGASYQGMMATGPGIVAKAIEHAISSKRPRTRYPLTPGARTMLALRRALPDGAWDAFMGTQFPAPKG